MFAARAYNKTAGILAAYPKTVESGKELKSVQGIGKGSMDKVACCIGNCNHKHSLKLGTLLVS